MALEPAVAKVGKVELLLDLTLSWQQSFSGVLISTKLVNGADSELTSHCT